PAGLRSGPPTNLWLRCGTRKSGWRRSPARASWSRSVSQCRRRSELDYCAQRNLSPLPSRRCSRIRLLRHSDLRAVVGLRAVPIFHSDWPLDSCKIRDCEPRLLLCCRDKAPRCRIPPDLVCNIVARAIYRSERRRTAMESPIRPRFVPDSFHTLSIGLSSAAVVIDKHNLSCVIPPQLGFQCRFRSRLAPTVSFALAAQAEPPYWAPPIPAKRSSPSSECLRIPRA